MILKLFFITLCTISTLHAVDDLPSLYKISAPKEFKSGEKVFAEVLKIVKEGFYDSKGLTDDDLYYAAIKGILRKISPPESPTQGKIWSEADKKKVYGNLQEKKVFAGINSIYDKEQGCLTVQSLVDGSPAEGLLEKNDRIMRIDGESLKNLSQEKLKMLLSGDDGKIVKLKIIRDIQVLDLDLKLKEVTIKNCISSVIEETAYIRVKSFSENISQEMKENLKSFKEQDISKIIIDLRGNTGGYFTEGVRAAELFLKKGTSIVSVLRSGTKRSDYFSRNLRPFTFDIVILTNGRTASSSEILAAALRAHNKAILIGSNSYGKAIIEKPFNLSNGYSVKFSVGAMYTYDGQTWHEDGLSPDIKSDTKFTAILSDDPAVKKALNYFKNK